MSEFNLLQDIIFFSSTFRDFQEARQKILLNFQGSKIRVEAMEHFSPTAKPAIKTCLTKLEECQIYMLVIGHTYGTIDDATGKSYTELEYDHAVKLLKEGKLKDIWVFKPTGKYQPESQYIDTESDKIKKLKEFREKVCKYHTPGWYDSLDDLSSKIVTTCFRSFAEFAIPILTKSGVQNSIKRTRMPEGQTIGFVDGIKPLTLNPQQKEKLELEMNEMNKILQGIGKEELTTIDLKSITIMGNYYYTIKKYDKAIEMYNLVLKEFPDDARALNNKGSALRGRENREEALKLFKRAAELDQNYTDPRVNMGGILSELDRPNEALSMLEEVYQKEKPDFTLLLNLGYTYSKLGNYVRAHELYDEAEKLAHNDTQILLNIAVLYQSERNYEKSIEYSNRILELDPDHVGGLETKGSSLIDSGQLNFGIYYLDRALKIDPNEEAALVNLALAYRRLHDFGEIRGWVIDLVEMYSERALKINKDDIMALDHMGWVYAHCKSYSKALEFFEESLKMNPKYVGTIMDKAMALGDMRDTDNAIKCVDSLEPEKNSDWQIMLIKYQIFNKAGRREDAIKELEKVQAIKPMWRFFSGPLFRRINWFGIDSKEKEKQDG